MESPPPNGVRRPKVAEMDVVESLLTEDPSAALWDFGDLLDFAADDHFSLSLDNHELTVSATEEALIPEEASISDRIRKRDPRLTCSNFLAGLVPCACPEIDEKLEEEEEGAPDKKRSRTARSAAGTARCQVPGCEADIRELKGYHRRHRVCLRCANATTVKIDGEIKRYCQQCGKFHVLSDFDEGKRSCRRKLERHNNRRRRKQTDSRILVENESQAVMQGGDVANDCEVVKGSCADSFCFNDKVVDEEALLESEDGQATITYSAPDSQNIGSDSGVSIMNPHETPVDVAKDSSKCNVSPSYPENKSAYSSLCPTGRISFKLYDWNPAEFPRRLRLQIFQWLANMPVELEGYIRPGCTILTMFIAMPKFMWAKILEDPVTHLHDLVISPGRMLSGRGNMHIYLNDMIFHVIEGGNSPMKVEVEVRAPKLHSIHPSCFEAGKPMEFVACGSNLHQPKLRFLISFGGKYLAYDYCDAWPHSQNGGYTNFDKDFQLYKISIPCTEPNLFGPAFVEVENQSGLSNFIPILIGDKEICSEMEKIKDRIDTHLFPETCQNSSKSCEEIYRLRREVYSEVIADVSWLLRKHASKNLQITIASQLQWFTALLKFLTQNESTVISKKVLENRERLFQMEDINGAYNCFYDDDVRLFKNYIQMARELQNWQKVGDSGLHFVSREPTEENLSQSSSKNKMISAASVIKMDMERRSNGDFGAVAGSTSVNRSEIAPLLNKEVVMDVTPIKERPRKSYDRGIVGTIMLQRPTIFAIMAVAVCFGICAAIFHPHKFGEIAVSIRRCLTGKV